MDGCKTFVRPVTYNAKSMSIKTVEVCNFVYLRDYGLEFSKAFFLDSRTFSLGGFFPCALTYNHSHVTYSTLQENVKEMSNLLCMIN